MEDLPRSCGKWLLSVVLTCISIPAAWADDDWLPVTPEELQMTSEPNAPAVPAIYLYRQVDRDDGAAFETTYLRVKVLTEEGREYANVEIRYRTGQNIRDIRARTIHADGTVLPFDGEIFDKPLQRSQGEKLMAKAFTLPQVEVGSIVEYRFTRLYPQGWIYDSRWLLGADLYTREARFSLKPYGGMGLRWNWATGLPPGTKAPRDEKGIIRLDSRNIPAFAPEEHMPPEQAAKYRVEFLYDRELKPERNPDSYWKKYNKSVYQDFANFVNPKGAMRKAVAEVVHPDDSPEIKLRKLYARVQALRNLTYDPPKPRERDVIQPAFDVGDIWEHGFGYRKQLTYLFVALARAAGFEADALIVPSRDQHFFHPNLMNSTWLNVEAALVKLDGKEIYLDPATPYTQFGILPWFSTYVPALRLDSNAGSWQQIPLAAPSQSRIERRVALKLAPDGSLEGKLTIQYTGYESMWRRSVAEDYDEQQRREFLVTDTKDDIPIPADVTLTNTPDWKSSEALVAQFDVKIPRWATSAGQRLMLPVGLFGARTKHVFEHAHRANPVYLAYPYQRVDDVTIELPEGWQVSGKPQPRSEDINVAEYKIRTEQVGEALQLKRELTMNIVLLDVQFYPALRDLYRTVRTGDEDQVVITRKTPAGSG